MVQVTTIEDVVSRVEDGASIMIGGFLGGGTPLRSIDALVERGVKNLTLMTPVGSMPGRGNDIEKLFIAGQVKRIITSHIGTSPTIMEQMREGLIEVELYPMGTWVEKIRAGGSGLGGILTKTGLGTWVEEGKQIVEVGGEKYLLETPLRADFAFIKGWRADLYGNVQYRGNSINSNAVCATAADFTCVEAAEIVEPGAIEPTQVGTPSIFVDAVVPGVPQEEMTTLFNNLWQQAGAFKD